MSKQAQRGILPHLTLLAGAGLVLALAACSGDVASPAAAPLQDPAGPAYGRSNDRPRSRLYSNHDRYRNRSRSHGRGSANGADAEGLALLGADRITRLTLSTGTVDPLVAGAGKITKVQVKAYTPQGAKLYVSNFNHLTPNAIQNLSLRGLGDGALLYIRVHVRGDRVHATNCRCRDDDDRNGHGRDNDNHGNSYGNNGRDNDNHGNSRGNNGRDDDDDRDGHGRDNDNHGNSHGNNGRDHDNDDRWDRRGNGDDDDCNDDPRTDVVTLIETVKAGPALDVDINLPPSVLVGAPTLISSTVTEINGDVGTRADCQLWVNGTLVDRANGIWVDAGDAVTCAFTYTFNQPGLQQVEVRVSTNGGSVYQSMVVSDGGTVNVAGGVTTTWAAQVDDRAEAVTTVFEYTWWKPDGSHKEYSNTEVNATRNQNITASGTISRAAVFPVTSVDLTMESAGVEWQSEHWTALASAPNAQSQQCATRDMPENGAVFYLCNGLLGGATWGYQRFAGNVTYHSVGYSNVFDGLTGEQSLYSWNDNYTTYASGGQVRNLGSALQMRLTIRDTQGTVSFAPLVPVTGFSATLSVTPKVCETTSPEGLEGGSQTLCTSGRAEESGWRGSAAGAG